MAQEKRLQIRLDEQLMQDVEQFSASAGINVNQLVRGLLRWAIDHGRPGTEPFLDEHDEIAERPLPGCMWVGLPQGDYLDPSEHEKVSRLMEIPVPDLAGRAGFVTLVLDYSDRSAIKQGPKGKRRQDLPEQRSPKKKRT